MIGDIDWDYWKRDITVIGVDEVGRGAIAGPLTVAAVAMASHPAITGINDSKKVSPRKREVISTLVREQCFYSIVHRTAKEVDKSGISVVTYDAMKEAVLVVWELLEQKKGIMVLVDGNIEIHGLGLPQEAIVRGDGLSLAIGAASIVAKVARDGLMCKFDHVYPGYDFTKHKGYGTAIHINAIERLGPCEIHRHSVRTIKKKDLHGEWEAAKEQGAPWFELQRLGRYEEGEND